MVKNIIFLLFFLFVTLAQSFVKASDSLTDARASSSEEAVQKKIKFILNSCMPTEDGLIRFNPPFSLEKAKQYTWIFKDKNYNQGGPFFELPSDLFKLIFDYLPVNTVSSFSLTCKHMVAAACLPEMQEYWAENFFATLNLGGLVENSNSLSQEAANDYFKDQDPTQYSHYTSFKNDQGEDCLVACNGKTYSPFFKKWEKGIEALKKPFHLLFWLDTDKSLEAPQCWYESYFIPILKPDQDEMIPESSWEEGQLITFLKPGQIGAIRFKEPEDSITLLKNTIDGWANPLEFLKPRFNGGNVGDSSRKSSLVFLRGIIFPSEFPHEELNVQVGYLNGDIITQKPTRPISPVG